MSIQNELLGVFWFLASILILALYITAVWLLTTLFINFLVVYLLVVLPYVLDFVLPLVFQFIIYFVFPLVTAVDFFVWDIIVFLFYQPKPTDAMGECYGGECGSGGSYSYLGSYLVWLKFVLTQFVTHVSNLFWVGPTTVGAVDVYLRTRGGPVARGGAVMTSWFHDFLHQNFVLSWLPRPLITLAQAMITWVRGFWYVISVVVYVQWYLCTIVPRALWFLAGLSPWFWHVLVILSTVLGAVTIFLTLLLFVWATRVFVRLVRRAIAVTRPVVAAWWTAKLQLDQVVRNVLSDVPTPGFIAYMLPAPVVAPPLEVQVVEGNNNYMNLVPGVPATIVRIPPPAPPAPKGAVAQSRLSITVPATMPVAAARVTEVFTDQFVRGVLVRDWRCTKELVRVLRVEKKACRANRSKDNIADAHDFLVRYCKERGYGKLANMRVADLDLVVPAAADMAFQHCQTDFLIHMANQTVAIQEWSVQVRDRFIARVLGAAGMPIWPLGQP